MDSTSIDWSQISAPLNGTLFDKYTHQSILPPLTSLGLTESEWKADRDFALRAANKGFLDPLSIVYTAFKRSYPSCPSMRSFLRWLTLSETIDPSDLHRFLSNDTTNSSASASAIQSVGELIRHVENLEDVPSIPPLFDQYEQIWIVCSMSIRLANQGSQLMADTIFLDESVTRVSNRGKKATGSSRLFCLFAVTPGGKFSNQLLVSRPNRNLKINVQSSSFTRIIHSSTGDVLPEHFHQWLEDFLLTNSTDKAK